MTFIHKDRDFGDLVRVVAKDVRLSPALVEKDYWVTHTLWALHQTGLEVWFKGGTSLSKGFRIIERFSEDLDLRIEPGSAKDVPQVRSWKSTNSGPIAERRAFFEALQSAIRVPQAQVLLDSAALDKHALSSSYRIEYPGLFLADLGPTMRPFVLLEVGVARVTPFVTRSLSSFLHDWLARAGHLAGYTENQPREVRCVHPLVTLIEKLDAISRRFARGPMEPASFMRHYEDAARIVEASPELPPLGMSIDGLIDEMLSNKQIARRPSAIDPAFTLDAGPTRDALLRAHQAIEPMFWGPRRSLDEACHTLRGWLSSSR